MTKADLGTKRLCPHCGTRYYDLNRSPIGKRAITLSTHTNLDSWWELYGNDRSAYDARKQVFMGRMLDAVEEVLPDIRSGAEVILPGTPVTFQRFTRRAWGWVGGFPQTSLFRLWGPRLAPRMWMVGDSIFPGQSTTAVALGGMRVARFVLKEQNIPFEASAQMELRRIQYNKNDPSTVIASDSEAIADAVSERQNN